MSRKLQQLEHFRRPELFLAELINRSARGELLDKFENPLVWQRAVVVAVDVLGGQLENPSGEGSVVHDDGVTKAEFSANVGPTNPSNSVKARIITDGYDQFISDDDLRVFWPMFQEHDSLPIKPGEHVYVTFEDRDFEHGLWFGKVPGHENENFFRGEDAFRHADQSPLADKFDDSRGLGAESEPDDTDFVAGERGISDRLARLF